MSTETTTADSGAGAPAPAATPTNDAQATQIEQQQAAAPDPAKAEADKQAEEARAGEERKKNRTKAYIDRINGENAELRRWKAEQEARTQTSQPPRTTQQPSQAQAEHGPQLEDFNFDLAAWQNARDAWVIEQAGQRITQTQKKAEELRKHQETAASYQERVDAFTDTHPDFVEVVGSIDPKFLTRELQAAIMAHERGAEIAYHIATDEDALFNLASIRPELQAAAVDRLASRLGSATAAAATPPAAPPAAPQKPLTQAPPPAPKVGGRAVTETPPEKLTDDDWYQRDRAKRGKRG